MSTSSRTNFDRDTAATSREVVAVSEAISERWCATVEEEDEPHDLDEPSEKLVDDEALGVDGDDDLDLDVDESGDLSDEDADKLDVGGVDVLDESTTRADDDAPFDASVFEEGAAVFADEGEAGDEVGPTEPVEGLIDDGLPSTADDGGAEGLGDGSESFIDEGALPAMDTGAEGDFELNDLLSEMGFGSDDAWEIAPGFASDVSVASVRANGGVAVAAGAAAVVIGAGEHTLRVRSLEHAAHDCAASGDRVLIATSRGVEAIGPGDSHKLIAQLDDVSSLAIAADQLFALAEHALSRVDPTTGKSQLLRKDVVSIGAADGTLFVTSEAGHLDRRRGHDGDFERCASDATGRIVACASKALVLSEGEKAFRYDERYQRRALDIEGVVAGAAFGAEELLLLSIEPGAFVVSLADKLGDVRRIARVVHTGEPPVALAWDPARELIFVAGPAGLSALRRRLAH